MSSVKFLLDEDVADFLADAVIPHEPAIDIRWIGGDFAPPKQTPDPEVLRFAASEELALITLDKRTMPIHIRNHWKAGGHTWGVFLLRKGFHVMDYVDNLVLIWSASEAEEWQDRIEWLPW